MITFRSRDPRTWFLGSEHTDHSFLNCVWILFTTFLARQSWLGSRFEVVWANFGQFSGILGPILALKMAEYWQTRSSEKKVEN